MKPKIISLTKEKAELIGTCDCCNNRVRKGQKLIQIHITWDTPVFICRNCVNTMIKIFKDREKKERTKNGEQ